MRDYCVIEQHEHLDGYTHACTHKSENISSSSNSCITLHIQQSSVTGKDKDSSAQYTKSMNCILHFMIHNQTASCECHGTTC
jgi:hypothetical protein